MIHFNLPQDNIQSIASQIAKNIIPGDIFALYGPLGAGKSTFARNLIQALTSPETIVPSPTFTLAQTYESKKGTLWHFDFYRLNDPEEAWEVGVEDAFRNGICFIEWPEKILNHLPKNRFDISFEILDSITRRLTITPVGAPNEHLINLFKTL